MTTESNERSVRTDGDGIERPPFRGCVFCYGAEMTYYGARKLASRLSGDAD